MGKYPYAQFYYADFIQDTEMLSPEAVGCWVRILCQMWHKRAGTIEGNISMFSRLLKIDKSKTNEILCELLRQEIADICKKPNGDITVTCRRLQKEYKALENNRMRQQNYYNKRKPNAKPNGDITVQNQNQKQNTEKNTLKRFDSFWSEYPKKKSKGQAERAWLKLNPSEQLVASMIATIKQAKTSKEWTKEDGQFIPYPATWLNAKGWEDEYTPVAAKSKPQSGTFSEPIKRIEETCLEYRSWNDDWKPPREVSPGARKAYKEILKALEKELSQETFDTWFALGFGYDYDVDILLVAFPDQFNVDWLNEHHDKLLNKWNFKAVSREG
jgi:uncharacterized protein YdaU (DUF1376 family)